jgi:hypothetical protein
MEQRGCCTVATLNVAGLTFDNSIIITNYITYVLQH